jgi:fluoroquinolone resistance protein
MLSMNSLIRTQDHHADQTFREVHIEQGELVSSEFYDCVFLRCRFVGTLFRGCRFANCTFRRCDLSLVQVPESTFSSTRFEDSTVIGVDWTQATWPTAGLGDPIGFFNCAISHSTFIGLRLRGIQIRDTVARDVDFREAGLSQADFGGTDLGESMFIHTDLTEADLSRARNYHIDPGLNVLTRARFSLPEAMSLLYCMDIVLTDEA